MVPNYLYAYDFEIDGIAYNIRSGSVNEVEVTTNKNKYGSNTYSGNVSIPSEVVFSGITYKVIAIGDGAFYNCGHNIKTITMPNSIIRIGNSAFKSLWDISTIEIPNTVTCIGDNAFNDCQSLESIVIPNNVTTIGDEAFDYCLKLLTVTLGNSIMEIGKSAFSRCNILKSINIPNSVESIGDYAFADCTSLPSIYIPNSVKTIGNGVFSGCTNLKTVSLSQSISIINNQLFYNCKTLESIVIPNSVKTIGSSAFSGCNKLVTIQNSSALQSIGKLAFHDCYYLSSITFPNTLQSIGPQAFYNCPSLSLVISEITDPFQIDNQFFYIQPGLGIPTQSKTLKIPGGTKQKYIDRGWTGHFNNVIEDIKSYKLVINSHGKGSTTYGTYLIRESSQEYEIEDGSSVTLTFNPDNNYRINSVKVNSTDVTSKVSNNSYTIDIISSNTTVNVEYEAIPIPTYTLSITAKGNGSATYDGTTAKNSTKSFTLNEGTSATITFAPDDGYRIKSVKVNSADVTSSVSNNSYTVSNIKANTTVEVEFEAIPIPTYTLSVKATGNGSATYNGTTAKNNTQSFTLNEGTSATITFAPDNGYRIKSVKVNSADVTSSVSNNSYTVSNIKANTMVEVEFEAIPIPTYILSVKATGNGSATYNGATAKNNTQTFTLNEGTSATVTFAPDNGYRIRSVKVNSADVTSSVSNNSYTVSNIKANTTLEVEFEAIPINSFTLKYVVDGVTYKTYQIQEGATITPEATPTKEGSTFSGWSEIPQTMPSMDVTVTGSFIVNTYKLTYQVDGVEYKSYNVEYGATITPEAFPTKDGYTFSGWSDIPKTMPAKNVTIIGTFTKDEPVIMTYTLTITASGNGSATYNGTTAKNNTQTFTLNEGTSATITFSPDNGYRIKSVKVNSTDVTSSVSNNSYFVSNINSNTTLEVEFEAIPVNTYTLSVTVTGNGSATYSGTTTKNNTQTFTLNEGTSATITFSPDNGNRIKNVKVNGTDVTANVSNGQYTVSNIKANTTVEAVFEAVPITTYTLSIKASGNGSASYSGTVAKNNTQSFTLNEGTSATITFSPDNGYRIKSVKVNGADVTTSVSNNTYIVSDINSNTTLEVEFEAIPINSYTLKYVVDGITYQTYQIQEGATITPEAKPTKEGYTFSGWSEIPQTMPSMDVTVTGSFIVNTYWLTYQVDGVEYKSYDVEYGATITPEAFPTKEGYTFSGWSDIPATMPAKDVTVTGTFIKDEPVIITYTLIITATGNGSATFNNTTAKNDSKTFTLNEGTSATITFSPDNGYQIKDVKENGVDVTSSVSNNSYTVSIRSNTTVEVEFEAIPVNTYILTYVVDKETYKTYEIDEGAAITPEAEPTKDGYSFSGWSEIPATMPDHDVTVTGTFIKMESQMTVDGINYEVISFGNHTVVVTDGDYGQTLEVPATVNKGNDTWTVMGLKDGALDLCENLAAVIWEPTAVFNAKVSNPNLLLYVKDKAYASFGVNNVVVNGTAESIELTDASNGNDFYCPKAFKARKISYSHRYNMETGLGDSKGWETIVLPFDVQKYTSPKGEIVPFTKWTKSDNTKPFWLFELTASGYKDVEGIKANTPYIISMPNNPQYLADYVIIGLVTFLAENAEVKASEDMQSAKYQDRTFVPNYTNKAGDDYLALNVNSYYVTNPGTDIDGSKFIKGLRAVHPFEAYMTTTSNTRSIDVMDGMTTAIKDIVMTVEDRDIIKVYDTRGVLVKTVKASDDLKKGLTAGVYIVNGKKMIIK